MSKSYSEKMSRRVIVLAVVPLVLAFAAKAVMQKWGGLDDSWVALGIALLSWSAFMIFGVHFWKGLDDMQRQGHAVSWYWGSMAGLAVTACLIAATGKGHSEFTLGVATLLVLQLVCSLILYAFWWFKGRGFSFRSGE